MSESIDLQLRHYTEFFDSHLPMIDLEDVLTERVGTAPVRPLRPRQPKPRRRWLVGAAAAAAVLIVGGGVAWLLRPVGGAAPVDQPTTIVPSTTVAPPATLLPSTTVPPPTSALIEGEPGTGPGLSWVQVDLPTDADVLQILSDGEQFYLRDRSVDDGPMFTSRDGLSWEPADVEGLPLLSMQMETWSVSSGRHLVVESFISTRGSTELIAHVLTPGGSAIAQTLEVPVPAPNPTTLVTVSAVLTAVGPRGYYVVGDLRAIDFGPLVAETLGAEFRDRVEFVQLLDQEIETLIVQTTDGRRETIRAADVGLEDAGFEHDLAVPPTGLIGWYSTDGQEWVAAPQEGPFAREWDWITSLVAVDDGFLALDPAGDLWFTLDGIAWERVPGADTQGGPIELIRWRGQALARVEDGGFLLATSSGVSPLSMSETAPVPSRYGNAVAAGPAGIAYFIEGEPDGPFELVYSPDGANWNLGSLPDPAGEVYCCYFDLHGVAVGDDTVLVLEAASDGSGLALWVGRLQS